MLDRGILRDLALDLAGDFLLDVLGLGAGIRCDDDAGDDRNNRILPLRHHQVCVDAPDQHGDHRGPGDRPLAHEKLRDIHAHFASASVAAESVLSCTSRTAMPSLSRSAVVTTILEAACTWLPSGKTATW